MKKAEFVAKIAEKSGLNRKQAEAAVSAFMQTVAEALKRPARVGRNPATGEAIEIAASRAPVFKPGKGLKDEI